MLEYGRVWTEADEWEYQDFDSLYRNEDEHNRYGEPPEGEPGVILIDLDKEGWY